MSEQQFLKYLSSLNVECNPTKSGYSLKLGDETSGFHHPHTPKMDDGIIKDVCKDLNIPSPV